MREGERESPLQITVIQLNWSEREGYPRSPWLQIQTWIHSPLQTSMNYETPTCKNANNKAHIWHLKRFTSLWFCPSSWANFLYELFHRAFCFFLPLSITFLHPLEDVVDGAQHLPQYRLNSLSLTHRKTLEDSPWETLKVLLLLCKQNTRNKSPALKDLVILFSKLSINRLPPFVYSITPIIFHFGCFGLFATGLVWSLHAVFSCYTWASSHSPKTSVFTALELLLGVRVNGVWEQSG